MQEMIYLSRTKLNRFFREGAKRRPMKSIGLSAGPVLSPVSLSMEMSDPDERVRLENRLREVRNELDPSSLWFADPDVQAGAWVQFDGDFGYSVLETGKSSLFLMSQTPSTLQGEVALLLHGSPRNVLLRDPDTVTIGDLDSYIAYLVRVANELADLERPSDQPGNGEADSVVEPTDETARAAIQLYERIADRHDGVEYVQGLARVSLVVTGKPIFMRPDKTEADSTLVLSRLVVASPLYVEAVSRPS